MNTPAAASHARWTRFVTLDPRLATCEAPWMNPPRQSVLKTFKKSPREISYLAWNGDDSQAQTAQLRLIVVALWTMTWSGRHVPMVHGNF
jgi:hypothetical protein